MSTGGNAGLFGALGSGGAISALGLINPTVSHTSGATVANSGALVGRNGGVISAAYVSGGSVTSASENGLAGGLVGVNTGTIRASYSTAAVSGTHSTENTDFAGLVANNAGGSIIASYTTGAVTGPQATRARCLVVTSDT